MSKDDVTRRDVLKRTGVAAGSLVAVGAGTGSAAAASDDVYSVTIYPRTPRVKEYGEISPYDSGSVFTEDSTSKSDFDRVVSAVREFLSYIEAEGAIPGYNLSLPTHQDGDLTMYTSLEDKYGGECDLSIEENCDYTWYSDASGDDKSIQDAIIEDSDETDDAYLFVTDETNLASASGNAWDSSDTAFAWVGTKGGYEATDDDIGRIKNLAIQELCHGLIDHSEIEDQYADSYVEHGGEGYHGHLEHGLGKIRYTGGTAGPVTPGATFYEKEGVEKGENHPCTQYSADAAHAGNCDSTVDTFLGEMELQWNEEHDQQVTDCTVDAISKTYDNA